jgi:hypothetical protein
VTLLHFLKLLINFVPLSHLRAKQLGCLQLQIFRALHEVLYSLVNGLTTFPPPRGELLQRRSTLIDASKLLDKFFHPSDK